MSGYINITVVGSLGKDPEIRSTPGGKKVANFSVAVDQGFGDSKRTEWVNIVAWEKLADLAEKFLKKGKTIALSGTLQTRSWDKDGVKQYRTEVVARDITFMDTDRKQDGGGRSNAATTPARRETAPATRGSAPANDEPDPFGDDIPF